MGLPFSVLILGQFFSRSITSLVVPVMGKKKAPNEGKFEYHINEGVFGTFFVPKALLQTLEIKPIKVSINRIIMVIKMIIKNIFRPHQTPFVTTHVLFGVQL